MQYRPGPRWTPASIRALLLSDDRAVMRAFIVLYERQTEEEKHLSSTRIRNGVGFSSAHARWGSYVARLIRNKMPLFPSTMVKARKIALQYAGQLCDIANEKLAERRAA